MKIAPRQIAGAAVAIAAIALTLLGPNLTFSAPEPRLDVGDQPPVAGSTVPAPEILALAERALARDLPEHVDSASGSPIELESVGSQRAILCLAEDQCALVRRGLERVLINDEPGARETLRRAAEAGEPR